MTPTDGAERPTLTLLAIRRWIPALARRAPDLLSAYLVPGRIGARTREAAMLGVTSVNQCRACASVHERWGQAVGLPVHDPLGFAPDEAAAYAYGRALALDGPRGARTPDGLSARHRRELEATAVLMQVANLAGNRFLPERAPGRPMQIGDALTARLYDTAMRGADRAGLRRARERIIAAVRGDVLEIGIGTGLNLSAYPTDVNLHAIDPSGPALALAAQRATRLGRTVVLAAGDAATLPYPDDRFDVVVGTFVLCSVDDVGAALREAQRVLRPGGTMRFLEHSRSDRQCIARLQTRLAPAWSRASGGCRLDQDVHATMKAAGLRIIEERARAGGLLVEVVVT
ncbi:MAG: class I SAM-dependent methyltransferase [Chloroflexota bacterium]